MKKTKSILLEKADKYAHGAYKLTRDFPEKEKFGITSQLRRSALSVPLNITEGFARQSDNYYVRFLKTAYSSLKEAQYLLMFAKEESFGKSVGNDKLYGLGDEVAAMLWKKIESLERDTDG